MSEPIKSGDIAVIVAGALGDKGPNIGKTVTVGTLRGEHSKYGRIWAVSGENLVTEYGAVGSSLDCAAIWLRKIEPPRLTNVQSCADSTMQRATFVQRCTVLPCCEDSKAATQRNVCLRTRCSVALNRGV